MQQIAASLEGLQLNIVGFAWLLFALIFLLRKRPEHTPETVRDRRWSGGLFLQILGYGIVWLGQRAQPTAFLNFGPIWELICALASFVILTASLILTYNAVETLGKEWSLTARLVQDHELATGGPYRIVRHPIYTGMLGMLVGTAIAISQWPALVLATIVFLAGTFWRIRLEEQLLITQFGDSYRHYARTVPALIPFWHGVQGRGYK